MTNLKTKIEPATVRILQTEGFRLKELIKAMFGNQATVELSIRNVPQTHIDFMNGDNDSKTSNIVQDDYVVYVESEDNMPF